VNHWDRIVTDHGPGMLRLASRILGYGPDAEDAVQEAFLEVYRIEQREVVASHDGLLRRVVVHRALDRIRRRRTNEPLGGSEIARDAAAPDEIAVGRELAGHLREAIGSLTQQQAAVFCLRYFEDLSYSQIGESLGIEVGAVGTALNKARGRLKTVLAVYVQGD
jgi:RNA polymerase sigma-70 factor, ECF subfamily